MPKRMVTPKVSEVSGVDHPAHLAEGWLLMKALGDTPKGSNMPELSAEARAALPEEAAEYVKALEATVETATAEVEIAKAAVVTAEPTDAEVFEKAIAELPAPVREALLKQQRDAATDRAMAKALFDQVEDAKFETVAKSLEHLPETDEEFAKSLRSLSESDPTAYARIEKTLRAAEAAIAESDLYKEIGSDAPDPGSALGKIEAVAKSLRAADPALTPEAAFVKAVEDNPEFYKQYITEA